MDRLLRCSLVSEIGFSTPVVYSYIFDNQLNMNEMTTIAITPNGHRVLIAYQNTILFFKIPSFINNSNMSTADNKIIFLKQFNCNTLTSHNTIIHPTMIIPDNIPLGHIVIKTLHVIDIEKWMVIIITGDVGIATTVYSVKDRENKTKIIYTPCVKAFNHNGKDIIYICMYKFVMTLMIK